MPRARADTNGGARSVVRSSIFRGRDDESQFSSALTGGATMSDHGRLASIDVLRGLAVLAVIVSHLPYSNALSSTPDTLGLHAALPGSVTQWTQFGQYGVHLFLVLSGFCIHLRWVRSATPDAQIDFWPFWKRRLRRLYPPYFVALIATLFALFVFHGVLGGTWHGGVAAAFGYGSSQLLALDLALLVLLLHNVNGAADRVGNGPFWSLALEEQLYLLYFPLIALRKRFGWSVTFAVTLATSAAWRVGTGGLTPEIKWSLLGPARWFEWMLGALAVEAHYGRVKVPGWVRHPAHLTVAAVAAIASDPPRHWFPGSHTSMFTDLLFGWFFFALVHTVTQSARAEAAARSNAVLRALVSVGVASYSLYLTHQPTLVVAKWLALKLHLPVGLVLVLRLTLAMAVGYAFHYLVERRFIDASRPPTRKTDCIADAT
jgi:peptidoglycan/LPS O-acetylase OafA/YrhL